MQAKLTEDLGLMDCSFKINLIFEKEINKYNKWIEETKKEMEELKEDSEKRIKLCEKITNYQNKINDLKQ